MFRYVVCKTEYEVNYIMALSNVISFENVRFNLR
jgi:hypothetical protein